MKKKTKSVILLCILAVFCLCTLAACGGEAPDIFEYDESELGIIGKLVKWMHSWVGNYGWTVVVFTIFLKLLMSPLDIWQRYASRKSSLKMQRMQPIIEDIDRRYGPKSRRAAEEKQKLYKKQGFGMMGTCLPMIVSMVIFFVMFAGLRDYSTYSSITNFRELSNVYYTQYTQNVSTSDNELISDAYFNGYTYQDENGKTVTLDGYNKTLELTHKEESELTDEERIRCQNEGLRAARRKAIDSGFEDIFNGYESQALADVNAYYADHHESWLWVQNVWQPDTWADVMQPYQGGTFEGGGFSSTVNLDNYPIGGESIYNKLRDAVMEGNGYDGHGGWNGLMILPFASIGLSFLSMFISQYLERRGRKGEVAPQNQQQKVTNRTMMIIMPLMMAWFGFIYTGAFAIYMVCNYTLSILSTIALRYPVEKMVQRRLDKDETRNKTGKAKYMR